MGNYYIQFLTTFIIFLAMIQEGLLVPSPPGNNQHFNQMIDVGVLLNRLDQLEAKVEQHDVKDAEHDAIVAEHELKINSQQKMEIDQLKKKNSDLEEKNHQLTLASAIKKDDVASRDFLPRSCFEIKATDPTAQSGIYSIDPDGQIGADEPILVYCDMQQTTSIYHDTEDAKLTLQHMSRPRLLHEGNQIQCNRLII